MDGQSPREPMPQQPLGDAQRLARETMFEAARRVIRHHAARTDRSLAQWVGVALQPTREDALEAGSGR